MVILEVEGLGLTGEPPSERRRSPIRMDFRLGLEKWIEVEAYSGTGKSKQMWQGYLYQREA